jgi:hypothetical protein
MFSGVADSLCRGEQVVMPVEERGDDRGAAVAVQAGGQLGEALP